MINILYWNKVIIVVVPLFCKTMLLMSKDHSFKSVFIFGTVKVSSLVNEVDGLRF